MDGSDEEWTEGYCADCVCEMRMQGLGACSFAITRCTSMVLEDMCIIVFYIGNGSHKLARD
jgi:hypothetical protein